MRQRGFSVPWWWQKNQSRSALAACPARGWISPCWGEPSWSEIGAIAINEEVVGSMVGPPQPGRTPFAPGSPALGDRNQVSDAAISEMGSVDCAT